MSDRQKVIDNAMLNPTRQIVELAQWQMKSIIESNDLEFSIWKWLDILENKACDPNVERHWLMEDWVAQPNTNGFVVAIPLGLTLARNANLSTGFVMIM